MKVSANAVIEDGVAHCDNCGARFYQSRTDHLVLFNRLQSRIPHS
jgi:hypothetical protein